MTIGSAEEDAWAEVVAKGMDASKIGSNGVEDPKWEVRLRIRSGDDREERTGGVRGKVMSELTRW